MATSACTDTSEAIELFEPQGMYLKPIAKINVSVQLPQLKSSSGKSLSNWEVMEKLKHMVKPDQFIVLKVVKSTLEFIRFEGELENKRLIKVFIDRLDAKTIKLSGFPDSLKVRACEAKPNFPTRHDWDSFFRDAKNMNEMRPGERPDTLYLRELPSRWFANRKDQDKDKPSEYVVKKVFETYGDIRCVDIPMLDPYRKEMTCNTGAIQTFSYGQDLTFETFIQYKEYIGFVKAMNALRGMKLMYKDSEDKAHTVVIKVDFDKSKHLSDKAIRKRRLEREKLMELEQEKEAAREAERKQVEQMEEMRQLRKEQKIRRKEERRQLREEKRKLRQLEQKQMEEERLMQERIAMEERKILIAQRKLETIRLLSELFSRVKTAKQAEEVEREERELEEQQRMEVEMEKKKRFEDEKKRLEAERKRQKKLERKEQQLRQKILRNLQTVQQRKAEKAREELRKKVSGKTKLKSTVASAILVKK